MIFVGIDPGVTGGVAALRAGDHHEPLICVDAPVMQAGTKRLPSPVGMDALLLEIGAFRYGEVIFVALETQVAMPRQRGGGTLMWGFGVWEGLIVARGWPYVTVRPQAWKQTVLKGLNRKEKGSSRRRAEQLFPGVDLGRRSDEGRSEALLIAEWARSSRPLASPTRTSTSLRPTSSADDEAVQMASIRCTPR